jgi:predicted DNA repair protein MutK
LALFRICKTKGISMPSGLVALLDDVSVIARAAAASLDDVGAGVAKAGTKAAGVVIDDAAVTPGYVTGFTPDRELPIIWKITKGSLRNKLLILLPIALLLSAFLPQAITPILMAGGLYLAFEGAEKIIEKLGGAKHGETLEDPIEDAATFEKSRVSGAVRTDLILSAEIMAIALAEVSDETFLARAVTLALVGIAITVGVYGAVALIVKMDDVGLHLTKKPGAAVQALGRGLLKAMPVVLKLLGSVGTLAMLWVGGGIILHGLEELGLPHPAHVAHGIEHALAEAAGPLGPVAGWLGYALASAVVGLVLGAVVAVVIHLVAKARGKGH